MSLSRLTTWSGGQVLTAAALNAEFDNVLANPLSLISTASVASKGLLLVGNATTLVGLAVGSDGWVLTADSTQSSGVKWAAAAGGGAPGFNTITSGTNTTGAFVMGTGASLVPTGTGIIQATNLLFGSDAKGDVAVRGTSVYGRLGVGTDGQVLTADSTQASGVKWAAASGGAVSSVSSSDGTLTISPTTGAVVANLNPLQGNLQITSLSIASSGVVRGLLSAATQVVRLEGWSANTSIYLAPSGTGSVALGSLLVSFGSGEGVIGIYNCTTAPSTNPTGGGVLYVESGALKYKGSSGTTTQLAVA